MESREHHVHSSFPNLAGRGRRRAGRAPWAPCAVAGLAGLLLLVRVAGGCVGPAAQEPAAGTRDDEDATQIGRVVVVFDGDTVRVALEGGSAETVRLIGVDAPEVHHPERPVERFGREAAAFTTSLARGQRVRLEADAQSADRDRHGRLLRYVFLPDGRLLNAEIITQGFAHALTLYPFGRMESFRVLEREAREAGRGLWGANGETAAGPSGTPLSPFDAARHVGETRTVCGEVASARYLADRRGRPTFLNLGRAFPEQPFTVVIWGSDRAAFGRPEERLAGRQVCVSGMIELYRDVPQIVVRTPAQLREPPPPL